MPWATAANSDTDTHLVQKYHLRATLPHRGYGTPNDLGPDRKHPPPAAQPLSLLEAQAQGLRELLLHSDWKKAPRLHLHRTALGPLPCDTGY